MVGGDGCGGREAEEVEKEEEGGKVEEGEEEHGGFGGRCVLVVGLCRWGGSGGFFIILARITSHAGLCDRVWNFRAGKVGVLVDGFRSAADGGSWKHAMTGGRKRKLLAAQEQ